MSSTLSQGGGVISPWLIYEAVCLIFPLGRKPCSGIKTNVWRRVIATQSRGTTASKELLIVRLTGSDQRRKLVVTVGMFGEPISVNPAGWWRRQWHRRTQCSSSKKLPKGHHPSLPATVEFCHDTPYFTASIGCHALQPRVMPSAHRGCDPSVHLTSVCSYPIPWLKSGAFRPIGLITTTLL